MKIFSDSYFCIGQDHIKSGLPCQDYARSGVTKKGVHYAVVSDGCSGAPDTDIGSRMITLAFEQALRKYEDEIIESKGTFFVNGCASGSWIQETLLLLSDTINANIGINIDNLYATLIAMIYHESFEEVQILLSGDGGFSYLSENSNHRNVYQVTWDNNMPPYMAYMLNSDREQAYAKAMKNVKGKMMHSLRLSENNITRQVYEMTIPDCFLRLHTLPIAGLKDIFVFTDGMASFPTMDSHEVVEIFTDIKIPHGMFIKRTCMANLKKLDKTHIQPTDDFSMAGLIFNHDNVETEV